MLFNVLFELKKVCHWTLNCPPYNFVTCIVNDIFYEKHGFYNHKVRKQ